MATTQLKYQGDIDNTVLHNMAVFYGWTPMIPDPNNPGQEIPNPVSDVVFACLNVLGTNFMSLTVDRCCEPQRADIPPKDYPAYTETIQTTILNTTTVYVDGVQVYPTI